MLEGRNYNLSTNTKKESSAEDNEGEQSVEEKKGNEPDLLDKVENLYQRIFKKNDFEPSLIREILETEKLEHDFFEINPDEENLNSSIEEAKKNIREARAAFLGLLCQNFEKLVLPAVDLSRYELLYSERPEIISDDQDIICLSEEVLDILKSTPGIWKPEYDLSATMLFYTALSAMRLKKDKRAIVNMAMDAMMLSPTSQSKTFISMAIQPLFREDSSYAASQLLPLLKSQDERIKSMARSALQGLEGGIKNFLNISDEGLFYLGKKYNLGEFNNPDYSAKRLTSKGEIGIFDQHGILIKYFNPWDFFQEGSVVNPRLLDFEQKTLFLSQEESGEKGKRESHIENFKSKYLGFYNLDFFKKTGVHFNDLNFREQGWFMTFYENADDKRKLALNNFARKYGENGLKSFLSLEFGENVGDQILDIGDNQKLNHWQAQLVFGKIAELADLANEEEKEFQKLLTKAEGVNLSGIQLELLKKAHDIILRFSGQEKDMDKLLRDLDQSKIEITMLSTIFKSFKEQGKLITFEDIRDLKLSYVESAAELSRDEKEEMIAMAEVNWQQNPALKDVVIAQLREDLYSDKKQKIYILRYLGKIASFIRFEETDHGTIYAGSFNVKTELRGVDVGNEMIDRTLIAKSQEKKDGKYLTLVGTVSPRIPVGTNYVEDVGFVINGIIANYHKTGEPLFTLELNNNINPEYKMTNIGKSEEERINPQQLIAQYKEYSDIKELIGNETIILRYDMKTDLEKMMQELPQLLIAKDDKMNDLPEQSPEPKYVATRYFKEENDQNIRYFVLEKI